MALGWIKNIEELTKENETFRTVVYTGKHAQLTVMSLLPGEEIGNEVHTTNDQFLRFEQGTARIDLGPDKDTVAESHEVSDDWAVIIPSGTWHNVVNTGEGELKLYSLYSPAAHPDGTVHRTKAEADAAELEEA